MLEYFSSFLTTIIFNPSTEWPVYFRMATAYEQNLTPLSHAPSRRPIDMVRARTPKYKSVSTIEST